MTIDAKAAAYDDCETVVHEGADPADLDRDGADDALINAMGRDWVLEAAGAPDDSDESWDTFGLPWCAAYSAAYRERARELAGQAAAAHDGGDPEVTDDDAKAIRDLALRDTSGEVDDSYARTGDAEDTIRRWRAAGRSANDRDLCDMIDRVGVRAAAQIYQAARR